MAVSPSLDPIELTPSHSFRHTTAQSTWASINIANKRWLCGVFYRPKPKDMEALDCLEEILANFHPERFAGILLLGDFNVDFASTRDNRNSTYFEKLTAISDISGLHQLVTDYTRIPDATSPSMIDLVFSSSTDQVYDVQVTEKLTPSADHCMVTFNCRGKPQRSSNLRRTFYQYDRADVVKLNDLILNTDWNNIFHDDWPIDWVMNSFTKTFFSYVDKSIPKVTKKRKFKPWFSRDLKRLSTKKQKAYHKAKRTGNQTDWDTYRVLNNQFSYAKKKAYNSHWEAKFAKNDNLKSFWSFVRSQRAEPDSCSFVVDGAQSSNPSVIANGFNQLFASYFTSSDVREITSPKLDVPPISHINISVDLVFEKIKSLSPDKAVGPDDISCRMLKLCANSISPVLARIFNISISSGTLPSSWKTANVVPVYKKGNRCDLKNYRPIALTSIVVKMLESIVSDHIRHHLLYNGLLYSDQHGFSPGKSCSTALSEAVCEWNRILDRRTSPSPRVDLISVDYSRAFDSISHAVLLEKLHHTYGFRGPLLNWISSFISNRKQRVVFRGQMSAFVSVLSGVPQGSVLGPLLFNIYTNDLHLHLNSKVNQYADDSFISRTINNYSDEVILQNDLNTLDWWSENNALQLNPQKCQVMCICRRTKNKPTPVYYVSNTKLSVASSLRLLGVQVSSDLSWNEHVSNVTKKCNRLIGFLKTVVGKQNPNILLTLYRSLVLPVIDFCSPVWFVYRKNHINNLELIQRRATRFILGQKRGDQSYKERLLQLKIMDLNSRRKYLSICFACKCILNSDVFNFGQWTVNARHLDNLLFNDHITPRTDSFKYTICANFPRLWAALPESVRDRFLLNNMNTFKYHLKKHFRQIEELELDS